MTALVFAAALPAGAADETGVGIVGDVVEVTATATIAAHDTIAIDDEACVWELAIEDDVRAGVYSQDGGRMYSDTGRWFQLRCDGELVDVGGMFVSPEGGGFSPTDLLEQAKRLLDPPEPSWSSSPDGVAVPMVVQLPTWLWVDDVYWSGGFVGRATTPSRRVWAEASARPATTVWSPGDGSTVVCVGAGSEWRAGSGEPDCAHTYRHSTAGTSGYPVTVTVEFDVWGSTSHSPTPVLLGTITRTSPPVTVVVGEIQALETSGT